MSLPSSLTSAGNLPTDSTTFVGRETELRALESATEEAGRFVTLVGAPGIGKTRLALRLAERAREGAPAFVDLTAARTATDVCSAVGLVLGVLFTEEDDLVTPIGRALQARGNVLLVLDNFDYAVDAGAVVDAWASAAPEARLVVTSRERLRLPTEQVIEVGPLELPGPDERQVERAKQSAAMGLLLDRAPDFELTAHNLPQVGEILRQVDGIPLVIELAAARLSVLHPDQLLERMHDRLDLLTRRGRGGSEGRSTLRGALDWSWDALTPEERRALAVASVFHGGFTLEAFEAIVGLGSAAAVDALQALTEKSLIRTFTQSDRDLTIRFLLFESVRVYAREKLAELDFDPEPHAAHARYFANRGGEALAQRDTHGEVEALRLLTSELDNLLAAERTLGESEGEEAQTHRAALVLCAAAVMARRGPGRRLSKMTGQAIAHPGFDRVPANLQAELQLVRARASSRGGDMESAVEALRTASVLADEAANPSLVAEVWTEFGQVHQASGRLEAADDAYDRAEAVLGDPKAPATRSRVLQGRGLLHQSRGRLDEAFAAYDEALGLARKVGALALEATLHKDLGTVRLQQRRFEEAREHYERVLVLHAEVDDATLAGIVEGNLGILEQESGHLDQARLRLETGLDRVRRCGSRLLEAHLQGYLGALHHERGDYDEAARAYQDAIFDLREIGDARLEGVFLAGLAAADAARDRIDAAREHLALASRVLEPIGDQGLLVAVELHGGHLELALARRSAKRGDLETAESARARAVELCDRARTEWASLLGRSDDARFAGRLLERESKRRSVVFHLSTGRVEVPEHDPIDLGSRAPLRRMTEALVRARLDRPGVALTSDELIEAGWPGERMTAGAASNRFKVALSTLRKLGLRSVLRRSDEGYLLDPSIATLLEDSS